MVDPRGKMDVEQLVAGNYQAVYRYAYRLAGSVPDAEDLTQHVFLVAEQKLDQLRKVENARGWLFTILRNSFLRSRERREPVPAATLQLNLDSIPAEMPQDQDIDRERLQNAISELPADFRMVLLMFYFEECSYREIADSLNLPIGTVMSRLARAKQRLRSILVESMSSQHQDQEPNVVSQQG